MRRHPFLVVALVIGLLVAGTAAAEDSAVCPRCEHRFVRRSIHRHATNQQGWCRVCLVQRARLILDSLRRRHTDAKDDSERTEAKREWAAWQDALPWAYHEVGDFADSQGPQLARLASPQELAHVLLDEAERFTRRQTWSQQMANALSAEREVWLAAKHEDAPRALWVYDDLHQAWTERAKLYRTLATRYEAQALDPRGDALAGLLPPPSVPADLGSEGEATGATKVADKMRQALRALLVLEHGALVHLLALTRGNASAQVPTTAYFEKLHAHWEAASTASMLTGLDATEAATLERVRSNLLTDGHLAYFFQRAPRLAAGLRRYGRPVEVASVRELGPLSFANTIRGRDGGYSARFGGGSVWTFGDTVLEKDGVDGERWRSSTWCQTRDENAADGLTGWTEPLDRLGVPFEFLPFTDEERTFNRTHNREQLGKNRKRWALWPGPIVVHPRTGAALVFYGKLKCGDGQWNFKLVGHSLARWPKPDAPIIRPTVAPGTDEPTLLFGADDVLLGQGALVVENRIYAYGVKTQGLSWPCILARVGFDEALRKDAWRYYAGADGWVADPKRAVEIMQAAPQLSVHWNAHLERYITFYGNPLRNSISMRTAKRPEGPWSKERLIHDGVPPVGEDQWNYCGLGHAELQREGGRAEYVSYYRTTGFLKGEIRLIEIRFR